MNENEWVVPRPLTVEAVEQRLSLNEPTIQFVLGGKPRSAPAADARVQSLLSRATNIGAAPRALLRYQLGQHLQTRSKSGWQSTSNHPVAHLLARYAVSIVDEQGIDVTDSLSKVLEKQRRENAAVVTTTGGQLTVLEENDLLSRNQSASIFGEADIEELRHRLNNHLQSRNVRLDPRLVSWLAEATENVREHAVDIRLGASPLGTCLLQMKWIPAAQLKSYTADMPTGSNLHGYLTSRPIVTALGLVELTVADTGPGLAASLASDERIYSGSTSGELMVFERAFAAGETRKKDRTGAGLGLGNMLESVYSLDGFVQVRSGRIDASRSALDPRARRMTDQDIADHRFPPWRITERALAAGAAFTVLVPRSHT